MRKPKTGKARHTALLAAVLAVPLGIAVPSSSADDLYWDINAADPGAGGTTPSGIWGADGNADFSHWSTDPAGAVATGPWIDGSTAVFSAGDDATGNYTVSLAEGAIVWAGGFRLENGNVTINHVNPASGSGMELGTFGMGRPVIDVAPGQNLTLSVAAVGFDAWHLTGGGTWTLRANPTIAGDRLIDGGSTLNIDHSLRVAGGGSITLRDGSKINNTNPGIAGSLIPASTELRIGQGGGVLAYNDPGTAGIVSIYTGNIVRDSELAEEERAVVTYTGKDEFRVQGANTANYTFDQLVMRDGLWRSGSILVEGEQTSTETSFGRAPETFTPDAIVLDTAPDAVRIAAIGASWSVTLNANRGITVGPGGGAITSIGTFTVPGEITGPGRLHISNWSEGQVTVLSGNNTFTGGLQVNTGYLHFSAPENLGPVGTLILGGLQVVANPSSAAAPFGSQRLGYLRNLAAMDLSDRDIELAGLGGVLVAGTVPSPQDVTYGRVTGTGTSGLFKGADGAGVATITHARIGGNITINRGTLRIAPDGTAEGASEAANIVFIRQGGEEPDPNVIINDARFDLTNNRITFTDAVMTGPNDTGIYDLVLRGRNGGTWDGLGIMSSTVAAQVAAGNQTHTLGVAPVGDNIVVRYTFPGDANVDGQVTIADLGILAANWQGTDRGWWEGDFNYDGNVTIADLGILAANWQQGVGGGASMSFAEAMAMFDVFDGVVVPEPTALGLLGFGALGLLGRRRRR